MNYIWEKLMVEAFVSPSNGFDLARLDPDNPPPAPWTLQPTNPELLEALTQWFRDNDHGLEAVDRIDRKVRTRISFPHRIRTPPGGLRTFLTMRESLRGGWTRKRFTMRSSRPPEFYRDTRWTMPARHLRCRLSTGR